MCVVSKSCTLGNQGHFLAVTAFLFPFSDINPKLRGLGDGSQINYTVRRLKYQHGVGFRMGLWIMQWTVHEGHYEA
jgi:hypothetical protein